MTRQSPQHTRAGFTLLEMLLATMIGAIVLAAINTAFFAALRLRASTTAAVERTIPLNHALSVLKADLRGIIITGGAMAGSMQSPGTETANNLPSQLDVFTTTGLLNDELPWGDVQRISYYLKDPADNTRPVGRDLVRCVTRNVLSTIQPDLTEQVFLHGVSALQLSFYDGANWQTTWDSSSVGNSTPLAVKVVIEFAADDENNLRAHLPLEIVVPLAMRSGTNSVASTGSGT